MLSVVANLGSGLGLDGRRANVATSGNMAEVQTAFYLTGQSQCPVPTLSYAETRA